MSCKVLYLYDYYANKNRYGLLNKLPNNKEKNKIATKPYKNILKFYLRITVLDKSGFIYAKTLSDLGQGFNKALQGIFDKRNAEALQARKNEEENQCGTELLGIRIEFLCVVRPPINELLTTTTRKSSGTAWI